MKKLLKTKTFWGGLAAIATGCGLVLAGDVPQGVNAIVSGLLAIFVRDGIRKIADCLEATAQRLSIAIADASPVLVYEAAAAALELRGELAEESLES